MSQSCEPLLALHFHAVGGLPQIIASAFEVLGELRRVGAVAVKHDQRVDPLVDRSNVDVVGRHVFDVDQLDDPVERAAAQLRAGQRRQVLVDPERRERRLGESVQRLVVVEHTRVKLVARPVDGVVAALVGAVELGAQLGVERRLAADKLDAVAVRHRQIHHAAVAPPAPRMKRQPAWQNPQLGRERAQAAVVVETERSEPELGPVGRAEHAAVLGHERETAATGSVGRRHAENAQRDVGEHRAKDARRSVDVADPSRRRRSVCHANSAPFRCAAPLGSRRRCCGAQ